jgi:zinc transporter 1/2/3
MILAMDTRFVRILEAESSPSCDTANDYDGRMGLRISSIFVILFGSVIGAVFPIVMRHTKRQSAASFWAFFIAKYFGSGVIIATAFIHLLAPAEEALRNSCLTGPITEYSWVEGITLMTIILMFFLELMATQYSHFDLTHKDDAEDPGQNHTNTAEDSDAERNQVVPDDIHSEQPDGHHNAGLSEGAAIAPDMYAAQLTSIFILEFGVVFHSVFIGLTLAVSGSEFTTLYIVIVFHQTFEGLGLGSRLATFPWPPSKQMTPYVLGFAYGLSTPIAIAIGLGVRKSYPPEGRTTLIVNGVFDSISAGILIYVGLVELIAHEFLFTTSMREGPIRKVLVAFLLLCLGAALMALLGKWA